MLLLEQNNFENYINKYNAEYVLKKYKQAPASNIWLPLINPSMYQKALTEFVKYGKFIHFPLKYIYQWMGIIMKNTALLNANSQLVGAGTENIPTELYEKYFPEIFKKYCPCGYTIDGNMISCKDEGGSDELDFNEFLWITTSIYDFISAPDGSRGYTDFALPELFNIINEYNDSMKPEQVIVLINRILDVTHESGDLPSIFITGGQTTLDKISNSSFAKTNSKIKEYFQNIYGTILFENKLRKLIKEEMGKFLR